MAKYASTVYRPSVLIIHRFALHGILDENGTLVVDIGIVTHESGNLIAAADPCGRCYRHPSRQALPRMRQPRRHPQRRLRFLQRLRRGKRVWIGAAFRRRQGPMSINCIETNHGDSVRPHERPERDPLARQPMNS